VPRDFSRDFVHQLDDLAAGVKKTEAVKWLGKAYEERAVRFSSNWNQASIRCATIPVSSI
jgi:hypothetical protein